MSRTFTFLTAIFLICLATACLGGLVWANAHFVRSQPMEKDFLVPWLGARTFIQYGNSPYSDPATQRAQILYYGRLASAGQDPLVLWLPFPVELFYFPIALISDYVLARAIWMTLLEVALGALAILSLNLVEWKPGRFFVPLIILFAIFWVYGAFSLMSANAAGFIGLALAGFLLAIRSEQDELAGGLLFVIIGGLRVTGVFVLFITWWIIFHRRWRVFWGFLMVAVVLLGLAFLFLPNWVVPSLRGILLHLQYNPGLSSTGILTTWSPVAGQRFGWVLAGGLFLMLLLEWGRTHSDDFRMFLWAACLSLTVTPLLGIPLSANEGVFLFIPTMLFLAIVSERRTWLKRWGVTLVLMPVLFAGLWFLEQFLLSRNNSSSLNSLLILFMPALLLIGLIWMRWWFIHKMHSSLEPPL